MGADAERFRNRARECRELARRARDESSRKTLTQMAGELEAEADELDKAEKNER